MRGVVCGECGEAMGSESLAAGERNPCPVCGSTERVEASGAFAASMLPTMQMKLLSADAIVESVDYFLPLAGTILENPTYELQVELAPPELPSMIVIRDSWGDIVEMSGISGLEDAATAITAAFQETYPEIWSLIEE